MRQISSSQTGMDDVEVRMNTVESRYSLGDIAPHFLQRPFRSPPAMYKVKPSGRFFSFLVAMRKFYFTVAQALHSEPMFTSAVSVR
jgi:hypothetical protein